MLYIMRHGMTEWNAQNRLQGRTDVPLNDEGRRMAAAAHDAYRDVHIDLCFSSPLKRALETAEIVISGRGVPIHTDDRLVEMSYGEYEGQGYSFQTPDSPINVLFQDPAAYTASIGGAETFDELFARAGSFLSDVMTHAAGKDILIVGHGAINSAMICIVKRLPISEFWSSGLAQCKMMRLDTQGL